MVSQDDDGIWCRGIRPQPFEYWINLGLYGVMSKASNSRLVIKQSFQDSDHVSSTTVNRRLHNEL